MKKTTLKSIIICLLLFSIVNDVYAQNDFYGIISGASTSGNGRAPQGSRNISRSVWLITATEMSAAGFINGDIISGIGFTYQTAQDITTTGNATFYMQNTADVTNTKSTTWATAISGMTTVSNASLTIPNAVGEFNYPFSGGTSFTYTGGGIYIAFDYQNLVNPVATVPNIAFCNTALTGGLKGAISAAGSTTPPTTIAASNFRPETRLAIPVTCSRPTGLNINPGATTTSSAQLLWNPVGGSNIDIEYGPYGFTQGTGSTFLNVTAPYAVSGLNDSSVYEYYVRTNCGGGDYSVWSGPFPFNTTFLPTNPTYNTSFEQEELPFIGWSTPNATPIAGDWAIGIYGPGALVQDGVASVVSVTPATSAANNWMFSRGVNLTAGSSVVVTMYMSNFQNGTTALGNYQVTVGNAQNIGAQTTVLGGETALSGATFVQKTFNYTTPSTGVYYFGVQNQTPANAAGTHAIIVDNFNVTETLSSIDVEALNFEIYPNPVSNVLNISNLNNFEIKRVSVTDINGRVVKNETGLLTQLNVADLNAGVYFVTIEAAEGKTTKKVIKQ